jgi:hypothetical protein
MYGLADGMLAHMHKILIAASISNLRLYDMRKAAIDQMVDDYLLQRAAQQEKLSVAHYLKSEADDKAAAEVAEVVVRKFYDANKDKLPRLRTAGSFERLTMPDGGPG